MKTKDEIKKAILNALGNPSSGVIVDHLDTIVNAVVGQDANSQASVAPAKETRILEATEKR